MQLAVAEAVARATRDRAVTDAQTDLRELRRRAVEAGRERSRRIIKTSRIDARTGELRYNPAGRLLRDWYLHVYLNTLRANLGEPAVAIDAQQVEDTTAQLHRVRPQARGLDSLHAVGVVRNVAVDDAAHAAAQIVGQLHGVGIHRAVLHAGDERFDGDPLTVHVTRHWYQRCYDDHVHGATRSRPPLTAVSDVEEHQVALTLQTGQAHPLIGADGIPLVTAQGTALTELDRRLAAGETRLVPPDVEDQVAAAESLRADVARSWNSLAADQRTDWLRLAESDPHFAGLPWSHLSRNAQTKITSAYVDAHRTEHSATAMQAPTLDHEPRLAAMMMFNHQMPLDATEARATAPPHRDTASDARDVGEDLQTTRPTERGTGHGLTSS